MLKLFLKFVYGNLAFYFNSEGIPVPYGLGEFSGVTTGGGGGGTGGNRLAISYFFCAYHRGL